ncbi:MAG: hypothetical protein AAGB05_09970 [Pseudomonadota bacterium]
MSLIGEDWTLGLGSTSRLSQAALAFVVTPENTALLAVGGEPLTVTVTAPAAQAGGGVFAPSDLDTGPVDLVPPALETSPRVGEAVTARPAVWAYDGGAAAPTRGWQWRADGVDIPGATQASYTPTAPEAGAGLSVVETATSGAGARSVASPELVIAP